MISARKFLKNNYKEEYGYLYKCPVSDEIIKLYNEKIGGAIKKNEDNDLTVFEFIGTHRGKYIPGSTLKGAFRSAYLMDSFTSEDFYKICRETENKYGKKFQLNLLNLFSIKKQKKRELYQEYWSLKILMQNSILLKI